MIIEFSRLSLLGVLVCAVASNAAGSTTVSELSQNNTSASSAFTTLSNGDTAPGNVSTMPLRKIIPISFTGKILAHWMPWWSCSTSPCDGVHDSSDPVRVHYSTGDPAQIDKAIADMKARGYDGVLVAEANTASHVADTLAMAAEMHKFPSFYFCISENHLNNISGATAQLTQLVTDMAYAKSHYFGLANYLKINGRPVVFVFDNASVSWTTASSKCAGNPLFVLDGASHATASIGGFSWFPGLSANMTQTGPTAISNLKSFYTTAASNPASIYAGSFFKGFDDALAPWTASRYINRDCGLTFVRALAAVTTNIPVLQVATWNDYEEGTEVETGIDNCASVGVRVSGAVVTPIPAFTGLGSEETVDHYEIYLSPDGLTLQDVGSVPIGGASLNLAAVPLAAGTYKVYVQMVGKSHMLNHLSAPSEVTISSAASNITLTSPIAGSTVSNPVTVKIATHESFTVARIQVWDQAVKIIDVINAPTVNMTGLQFTPGSHTLTINVKDSTLATRDSSTVTFQAK